MKPTRTNNSINTDRRPVKKTRSPCIFGSSSFFARSIIGYRREFNECRDPLPLNGLTIGSTCSWLRSMSPCWKNSLATSLAITCCISHGLQIAATSHAVIIIPLQITIVARGSRKAKSDLSKSFLPVSFQDRSLFSTNFWKSPRFLRREESKGFSESVSFPYRKYKAKSVERIADSM